MKKALNFIKKYGIGFVLGAILAIAIGVKATTTFVLDSTEVEYDNTLSGAAATTVRQALDYLNTKADALLAAQNSGNEEYQAYTAGNTITYDGEGYHVIADSGTSQDYVTLLKDDPLTVTEINTLGRGVDYNRANDGASRDWAGVIYDNNSINYANSNIEDYVDTWANNKFSSGDLKEVDGYKARLIKREELLPYYPNCNVSDYLCNVESTTPSWLYPLNGEYAYWTMSPENSTLSVWIVNVSGNLDLTTFSSAEIGIRPVINLKKSILQS